MSTLKTAPEATWNGTNVAAGMSEEALDRVIEDSFPASDPPSHTPLTSLGPPKGTLDESPAQRWWKRSLVVIGAVALSTVVAFSLAGAALIRWRSAR